MDAHKKILLEFGKELSKIIKGKFNLVLFGSYARGDYSKYSDIDVLLLTNRNLSKNEKEGISRIRAHISLKYDVVISCLKYNTKIYETSNSPFLLNVKKEGIMIWTT